jgi:hypothetical protein
VPDPDRFWFNIIFFTGAESKIIMRIINCPSTS